MFSKYQRDKVDRQLFQPKRRGLMDIVFKENYPILKSIYQTDTTYLNNSKKNPVKKVGFFFGEEVR
jgi:hypothetical protein